MFYTYTFNEKKCILSGDKLDLTIVRLISTWPKK